MTSLHSGTPTLIVTDPRVLAVRSVAYCRSNIGQPAETRITRQAFDAVGHLIASWDPRLWDCAPRPNLETVRGLSGLPLLSDCADAGWQLGLQDEAQASRFNWDSRGSQRQTEYDALQRPVAITEQMANDSPLVVERFIYGPANDELALNNQCGRLVRRDDPAGCQHLAQYGLSGASLVEIRQFLKSLNTPDWPLELQLRNALLEEGAGFASTYAYTPSGELHNQTDAEGNQRKFAHTVAGQLKEVRLQLESQQPRVLISDIRYNASGQTERETAGNGVVTTVWYGADDGRPIQLLSAVPANPPLQDLHYGYDPVGNVLRLEDQAQRVRHFKNQRIDPVNHYRYDTLYQLVEARGRQVVAPSYGPELPALLPTPLDPNQLTHYTQTFDYDAAGNLVTRRHSGAPTFNMAVSDTSNRSLIQHQDGSLPGEEDIANGFDAGGNQLQLQRGQGMRWDGRNQLSLVTLVKREDGSDDQERYIYCRRGERLRKVRITHTGSRTLRADVRYLPGLEIHLDSAKGEERHVINVDAGRSRVRVLHWQTVSPRRDVPDDQPRFCLTDLLGSCTLELDELAGLLNQEGFYAFGGTAWWAGKNALEDGYKTFRYSGKERDATGLYYYGYRYYAPWLQRWMCPDPAGDVDGLNRYLMVKNNPVVFFDPDGLGRTSFIDGPTPSSAGAQNTESSLDDLGRSLQAHFDSGTQESKKRFEYVERELIHQFKSKHRINSSFISDNFDNIFQPHHWQFIQNFRNPNASDYFASDVARYQYTRVAQAHGFFGRLPSMITRSGIINKQTIKKTKNLKSGTDEMLRTFMKETPNGKSTQRILNDFGLMATKVERLTFKKHVDFLIHVKPVSIHSSEDNPREFEKTPANDSTFESSNNIPLTHRQKKGFVSFFRKLFQ